MITLMIVRFVAIEPYIVRRAQAVDERIANHFSQGEFPRPQAGGVCIRITVIPGF
jgi:hypothetical protein